MNSSASSRVRARRVSSLLSLRPLQRGCSRELPTGGVRWLHDLLILAGFLVLAAVVGCCFPDTEYELIRVLRSSRAAVLVVAFMAAVTAPLVEEVIYRGVLYSVLQRSIGIVAAV